MQKFLIYRDRKIPTYLKYLFILLLINFTIPLAGVGSHMTFGLYIFATLLILLYLAPFYVILIRKVKNVIYISDDELLLGNLFPKRIKISDITEITVNEFLEISSKYKKVKIICYSSEENIQVYQSILQTLDNLTEIEIDNQMIIQQIMNWSSDLEENSHGKKIKGYLLLLLGVIVYQLITMIIYIGRSINADYGFIQIALVSILVLFQIYIFYLFFKRSKLAPDRIIIYTLSYAIINFILGIISIITMLGFSEKIILVLAFLITTSINVFGYLIINSYIRNSYTVKNFFIK